jgi:hypothetical protein
MIKILFTSHNLSNESYVVGVLRYGFRVTERTSKSEGRFVFNFNLFKLPYFTSM